jgi:hypothetical protein
MPSRNALLSIALLDRTLPPIDWGGRDIRPSGIGILAGAPPPPAPVAARIDPADELSDEMLDAYFQALARRAPAQPDLPLADDQPPTTRLPSAEELRPDLFPGSQPPPPVLLGPPPRDDFEEALRNPPPEAATLGPPPPDDLRLGTTRFEETIDPPTVRNALMPQSRGEQEEQDRSNRFASDFANKASTAAPFAIPGGPVARGLGMAARDAGALIRGAGNLIARSPTATATTGAGAVGAGTLSGTGETQEPSAADQARSEIARLTKRQTELNTEQTTLRERAGLFDNLVDPRGIRDRGERERAEARVRAAQAALNINQDGVLGPETRGRIDRERVRIDAALARNTSDRDKAGRDLEGAQSIVRRNDREDRTRTAEANLPRWARLLRDYNLPIALAAGGLAGPLVRWPTRRGVENLRTERITSGNNALTMGTADEAGRVGNLNAFFNRGGGPDPFRVDPSSSLGFTRGTQVPASTLYSRGSSFFQSPDYARMAGLGVGNLVTRERYAAAATELTEARRARDATPDPTQDQIDRVTRAEAMLEIARLAVNTSNTSLASYPTSAAVMRYRARGVAPNTNLAEAEVMRLNNLLAAQPGGGGQSWTRPEARDITPNIRPDPTSGSGYRRPSGHYASADEIELYRGMEESRRLSRRR